MPRRLSGNRSKQLRKDLSRESSGPTHATNRIPRSLRIPYLHLVGRFASTVAFQTHRGGRDRDSLAFRTAGLAVAGFWESSKDGKMRRRNFMTTNQRKTLAKATRSFGTLG